MRIVHVVGARPNFIKVAPVMQALQSANRVEQVLIHTGQHYDRSLSDDFFTDLGLPDPTMNLRIGSGSAAEQTARLIMALGPALEQAQPDWVFTVGSTNSTLAAALVSSKLAIPVAHIESGLRSHDRSSPEEVNRVLTDHVSSALFTSEPSANENLLQEGIPEERIHYVGNVMIDSLDRYRKQATKLDVTEALGLEPGEYVLVTLHRPNNVDSPARLSNILTALGDLASFHPVVFPMHPRTARNVKHFELEEALAPLSVLGPIRYLEFLALMDRAGAVVTDSGGVQEETTVLGIPCITLLRTSDRPITLLEGTNRLLEEDLDDLVDVSLAALGEQRRPHRPELWDGRAAERIAQITRQELADFRLATADSRQLERAPIGAS